MRTRVRILITALLLLSSRPALTQEPPPTWHEQVGCALAPDTESLKLTLPIEVLDQLERMSSSAFVHAFLIHYISSDAAGQHRLARCARAFARAPLHDFGTLRQNLPDAQSIIDALRTAEQARVRALRLADSVPTLDTAVAQLRADPSPAVLELSAEQFATTLERICRGDRRGACGTLYSVTVQIKAVRDSRAAVHAAAERARLKAQEAERAAEDVQAAVQSLATARGLRAQLDTAVIKTDSTPARELDARIARWQHMVDSLTARHQASVLETGQGGTERDRLATLAQQAQQQLDALLPKLQADLRDEASRIPARTVAALQGTRIGAAVSAVVAPPPAAAAASSDLRSPNLLVELTDFIIARMRREAVNSFIVNLHGFARSEPLLRAGFPETWALMQGLSTRADQRVDAVDVGRIPLTAWRATLGGDFVQLPVNLLKGGAVAICPAEPAAGADRRGASRGSGGAGRRGQAGALDSVASTGADSVRAPTGAVRSAVCAQRVATVAPLVPMATRLLEGDAVFEILRDAGSFTLPQGPDLPPEWRRVSQGLTVLATLAETYLAQGYAPTADPTRHPYLLTSRSLLQVPKEQRGAFVRLLLVRAVPSAGDVPVDLGQGAALEQAAVGTVRVLERIAARAAPADPRPADAGVVVRNAFDAVTSAMDVARALAPKSATAHLESIHTRWRAVSGALEAITSRDFGLALSRTTVLLRDVRTVQVPASMLTLAALASSLSEARDGAQVQAAFETAASPVGGWQGKRYWEGGASITAFPGFATGFERVIREGDDPEEVEEAALAMGASLPIGVEWQFDLTGAADASSVKCVLQVCGLGVFMPLIDLGALLSYRLDNTQNVRSEPNANVRQVFAPGLYASLALTRTWPVNVLLGGQLMPSLRSVGAEENPAHRSVIRYGIGIGMDILLLKL
ncbi:hypothetical protein [Longimicrobium sp.]|jgi:hypothetical protein|uniref:hypothetical protein n=1 Tax=Longimicrobium sp. TaxID=2029185 RepID=UPI002F93AEAE